MTGFLVELPGGGYTRKDRQDLLPDDMIVFDGPGAFDSTDALQRELDAEIETAGGLDAWRAAGALPSRLAA